ncbi:MAG: CHRD domain-containing protein [Gemmataceae bacterium]
MIRLFTATLVAAVVASGISPARGQVVTYNFTLSGPNESPPNSSLGTGSGSAIYNATAHTLAISANFTGLSGTTTASHIHAATASPGSGTAGVATQTPTFSNFPLGVTSGTFSQTLDLTSASSYNSAYITANGGTTTSAEAALIASINAGTAYLNIHSSVFSGGEIRGFLTPVPEPGSLALTGLAALAGLRYVRRRRRVTTTV